MKKIFIFLDSSVYSEELSGILSGYDEEFEEAFSVKNYRKPGALLKDIRVEKPQVIIINEEGRALLSKLLKKYPFIPVIVYGSFKNESLMNELLQRGISACLEVPFDRENVIHTLKQTFMNSLAKPELWSLEMSIAGAEARNRMIALVLTLVISFGLVGALLKSFPGFFYSERRKLLRFNEPFSRVFPTQYNNPTGIAVFDRSIWVCDWKTQNIYRHSSDNSFIIQRVFSFPEIRFSGITFYKGFVLTTDPWSRKIYKHDLNDNLKIIEKYDVPGFNPASITSDGEFIWLCDNATNNIYKLDSSFRLVKSYSAPGPNPIGISFDSETNTLWTIDSGTNRIYRHNLDDNLSVHSILMPPDYIDKLTNIAMDRDTVWLCSEANRKIYRYSRKILLP